MDIQSLTGFMTLAELRSFSKAAQALHVTQPAFSRRIQAIEEQLGLRLINRSTTPISLTPAGDLFLDHAKNLAGLHMRMQADMQAMATQMPQALHIEMSKSLASTFFPGWYKAMRARVRGLTFRLSHQSSAESPVDLRSRRADFSIHMTAQALPRQLDLQGLKQKVIGHDRLLFVKAARLKADRISLISYGAGSYMNACLGKLLGTTQQARMKIVFESPNSELARGMALAGFGAALLSENLIADDVRDGYLVPALTDIEPMSTEIKLLRSNRPLGTPAEALWKCCGMDAGAARAR